jgi:hypothetical protein
MHVTLRLVYVVQNIQLCVKFAWDFLQMESLKVVVQTNHHSKNMMKNAMDYMAMVRVLFLVANKHIIPQT